MQQNPSSVAVTPPPGSPVKVTVEYLMPQASGQDPALQFSKVDSVQLVGATSTEALNAALGLLQPPQQAAAVAPQDTLWKNMTPLAQQLVQSVEEAHQAIGDAVNMAARAEAQKAAQSPAVPGALVSKVQQVAPCACTLQNAV